MGIGEGARGEGKKEENTQHVLSQWRYVKNDKGILFVCHYFELAPIHWRSEALTMYDAFTTQKTPLYCRLLCVLTIKLSRPGRCWWGSVFLEVERRSVCVCVCVCMCVYGWFAGWLVGWLVLCLCRSVFVFVFVFCRCCYLYSTFGYALKKMKCSVRLVE